MSALSPTSRPTLPSLTPAERAFVDCLKIFAQRGRAVRLGLAPQPQPPAPTTPPSGAQPEAER